MPAPRDLRPTLLGLATALAVLTGCGADADPRKAAPSSAAGSPSATASSAAPAAAPPPAPRVGSCHRLTLAQANASVDERAAAPCDGRHTSVTIATGRLDLLQDGHLLAADSEEVRAQQARRCPSTLARHVGGSESDRRLSRLRVVWFGPSLAQAEAGADWFRCDVVALERKGRLAPLAGDLRGVLERDEGLDRYGTCGNVAPGRPGFTPVICSARHSWRAVGTVEVPRGAAYLGPAARRRADDACRDRASELAEGALEFRWAQQWPGRQEWAAGRRYVTCWAPV